VVADKINCAALSLSPWTVDSDCRPYGRFDVFKAFGESLRELIDSKTVIVWHQYRSVVKVSSSGHSLYLLTLFFIFLLCLQHSILKTDDVSNKICPNLLITGGVQQYITAQGCIILQQYNLSVLLLRTIDAMGMISFDD